MKLTWKQLPKKTVSSGAFLLNKHNELLIVKPTYKDGWELAGGIVDAEEPIIAACEREAQEELGISKKPERLLCIDYVEKHLQRSGHDGLHFVFYCGHITDEEIARITLPPKELSEYRFVAKRDLNNYFPERILERFNECYRALETGIPAFLQNGAGPFNT